MVTIGYEEPEHTSEISEKTIHGEFLFKSNHSRKNSGPKCRPKFWKWGEVLFEGSPFLFFCLRYTHTNNPKGGRTRPFNIEYLLLCARQIQLMAGLYNKNLGWLRLLCLACLCGVLLAVPIPLSSDEDCPYEPLPDSLDNLAGVGFDGELHSHTIYIANYTGMNHDTYFTISQPSEFKIYIDHSTVDIDIWLYNNATGNQITVWIKENWFVFIFSPMCPSIAWNLIITFQHTIDYSLVDESLNATLTALGGYKLRLYFYGMWCILHVKYSHIMAIFLYVFISLS